MGRVCEGWTLTPTNPTILCRVEMTVLSNSGTVDTYLHHWPSDRITLIGQLGLHRDITAYTPTPTLTHTHTHTHRVWSVQYNLVHDQLVLTASSDSQVVLTRMASIASEPLQHLDEEAGEK